MIVTNAGLPADVIIEKVLNSNNFSSGFDAREEKYVDMFEAGILDPARVVRCAVQNATSAASLMLTTEGMIAETPEQDK